MKTEILTESDLSRAAVLLREGELVAFPTETVYGLGAPVFFEEAIRKIYEVKRRPADNPLIVHISDLAQVDQVARDLPEVFFHLAQRFFPGPLTLVVKRKKDVPEIVSAGLDTIAIRMPSQPLARKLIAAVGIPLVAPSANLSGKPSSTCIEHVLTDFEGKIAAVVDGGPCQYGVESTVIDLVSFSKPTLLRVGALKKEEIEKWISIDEYFSGPKTSPGMKYRHYAPDLPVRKFHEKGPFIAHLKGVKKPLILSDQPISFPYVPLEMHTLYAYLRLAEEKDYDEVIIFCEKCPGGALANRLERITSESNLH